MSSDKKNLSLKITGIVQGVGFRPFIYALAQKNNLSGWVLNSSSGVEIEISGNTSAMEKFVWDVRNQPPPLARIDRILVREVEPKTYQGFTIRSSAHVPGDFVPISPDVSICPDCNRELFDPTNRRYRYPFINCTNCGPRFTIIKDIPYDRPLTTMADFQMCPECEQEYQDPMDRRFHAQPIACPQCGPQVQFFSKGGPVYQGEAAIQEARRWLREGKILAIKGLGGYHLACDARSDVVVEELRDRKRRSEKPFALMAFDLKTIRNHCQISPEEEDLLTSRQHPIVILAQKPDSPITHKTAPKQNFWGFMLPYTPMHLLLIEPEPGFPDVLVMTSGNFSEEPIAYNDDHAAVHLDRLADGFLVHDRPIYMRTDDSVARVASRQPRIIRRSRGYAPDSLNLPFPVNPLLAVGTELKNTFCLGNDRYAFLSHHIGDMENYETLQSFEEGIRHFEKIFKVTPQTLACDLHPDYLATRYALQRSKLEGIPLVMVQHHHAHLAACLVENGKASDDQQTIGLIFDGTGLGTDGHIWGGEILIGNLAGYTRRFHLEEMPLPGGDTAIRHPIRTGLAYIWAAGIESCNEFSHKWNLENTESKILWQQLDKQINTPSTTSMGRLFDAVSALCGICHIATYEGQAAIELENCLDPEVEDFYEFPIEQDRILLKPVISEIVHQIRQGESKSKISARFHNGIVRMVVKICEVIRSETGIDQVALSGGVWQNQYLFNAATQQLKSTGFHPLTHAHVPTNDGGVSLGQLAVGAYQTGLR